MVVLEEEIWSADREAEFEVLFVAIVEDWQLLFVLLPTWLPSATFTPGADDNEVPEAEEVAGDWITPGDVGEASSF